MVGGVGDRELPRHDSDSRPGSSSGHLGDLGRAGLTVTKRAKLRKLFEFGSTWASSSVGCGGASLVTALCRARVGITRHGRCLGVCVGEAQGSAREGECLERSSRSGGSAS